MTWGFVYSVYVRITFSYTMLTTDKTSLERAKVCGPAWFSSVLGQAMLPRSLKLLVEVEPLGVYT